MVIKYLLIILLCFFQISVVFGRDVVLLKNGDRFKGVVVKQDRVALFLKMPFGIIRIKKHTIKCIEKEKVSVPNEIINVYLKDGRALRGRLIRQNDKLLILRLHDKTIITLNKKTIDRVDWKNRLSEKKKKQKMVIKATGFEIKVRLADGSYLKGIILGVSKGRLLVKMADGSVRKLQLEQKQSKKKPLVKRIVKKTVKKTSTKKSGIIIARQHITKKTVSGGRKKSLHRMKSSVFLYPGRAAIFWRSAVLPSWGQFHSGQRTKGWLIAAGFGISLLGMYSCYMGHQNALLDWEYGERTSDLRERIEKLRNRFMVFAVSGLLIYLYNLGDAWFYLPRNSRYKPVVIAPQLHQPGITVFFNKTF